LPPLFGSKLSVSLKDKHLGVGTSVP